MTHTIYENFQTYAILRGNEYTFVRDQSETDNGAYAVGK